MSTLIQQSLDTLSFNTLLTTLSLADLAAPDAVRRAGPGNSIIYLAGHMLSTRLDLCRRLGLAVEDPWSELFGSRCRDDAAYPSVAEFQTAWSQASQRLLSHCATLSDADALKAPTKEVPGEDQTVRGALTFFTWHDSYHLGQIGALRTALGYASVQALFYRHVGKPEAADEVERKSGRG